MKLEHFRHPLVLRTVSIPTECRLALATSLGCLVTGLISLLMAPYWSQSPPAGGLLLIGICYLIFACVRLFRPVEAASPRPRAGAPSGRSYLRWARRGTSGRVYDRAAG